MRSGTARDKRPGRTSTAAMQQNTKEAVIPLEGGKHNIYRYNGSRGPHTFKQDYIFKCIKDPSKIPLTG